MSPPCVCTPQAGPGCAERAGFPHRAVLLRSLLVTEDDAEDCDEGEELGGLFRVSRPARECRHKADAVDCSRFQVEAPHDWDLEEVRDGLVTSVLSYC